MKIKQSYFLLGTLIASLILMSCGMSKERASNAGWEHKKSSDVYMEDGATAGLFGEAEEILEQEKKVIFNGTISLAVEHPDSTNNQLDALAKKYNGYVTELGSSKSIIRVHHSKMKAALAEVETMGKVQSKSVSGKDVTNDYLDFQIRLDNAQKARSRYLDLLEKAENVEAALLVEKELERLNGTIDMLTGRINRIDHLAEFSTITVYIKERKKPGILGYIGLGVYHSVKWLFVRN